MSRLGMQITAARNAGQRFAVESQKRAARLITEGRFEVSDRPGKLVPSRKGSVVFEVDEHVRAEVTMEQLAKMKPTFKKDGLVTPGQRFRYRMRRCRRRRTRVQAKKVRALGLTPLARLVAYAHAGVEPAYMGMGPVPATITALKRAGLTVGQLDVIESNEAFAAQACAVVRELKLDPARVKPEWFGHFPRTPRRCDGGDHYHQGHL